MALLKVLILAIIGAWIDWIARSIGEVIEWMLIFIKSKINDIMAEEIPAIISNKFKICNFSPNNYEYST